MTIKNRIKIAKHQRKVAMAAYRAAKNATERQQAWYSIIAADQAIYKARSDARWEKAQAESKAAQERWEALSAEEQARIEDEMYDHIYQCEQNAPQSIW